MRNIVKKWAIPLVVLGAAGLATWQIQQSLPKEQHIDEVVQQAEVPPFEISLPRGNYKNPSFDHDAYQAPKRKLQTAIGWMRHHGMHTAAVHPDGSLEEIVSQRRARSDRPPHDAVRILTPDSPFMQDYYSQASPDQAAFLKSNVRYIVLNPRTLWLEGAMQGAVGKYIGKGVIIIDTKTKPFEHIGIMVHEAQHSATGGRGYRLKEERDAIAKQLEVVSYQHKHDPVVYRLDTGTEFLKELLEATVKTADYLLALPGNPFRDVYPSSEILACDLVDAQVDPEILRKYAEHDDGSEHGKQLQAASLIALLAHEQGDEGLKAYAENQGNPQIARANAIYSLLSRGDDCRYPIRSRIGSGIGSLNMYIDGQLFNDGTNRWIPPSGLPSEGLQP